MNRPHTLPLFFDQRASTTDMPHEQLHVHVHEQKSPGRPQRIAQGSGPMPVLDSTYRGLAVAPRNARPVPAAATAADDVGTNKRRIGDFELGERHAIGGMAILHRAIHRPSGTEVIVKTLRPEMRENHKTARRFLSEVDAILRIDHPAVPHIIDSGTDAEEGPYIAMELLRGKNLEERIKDGPALQPAEILEIAAQVADVLDTAHRVGIVHRDIKPENIFLCETEPGAKPVVKLLDFGVAKLPGLYRTVAGHTLGTPYYMAPEQVDDAARADARSDLYALGCVLYELCCGVRPFEGTLGELLLGHKFVQPLAPKHHVALPWWLETLIMRLLEKKPKDRPASAGWVRETLRSAGANMRPPAPARQPEPPPPRRNWLYAIGVPVAASAAAGVGWAVAAALSSWLG